MYSIQKYYKQNVIHDIYLIVFVFLFLVKKNWRQRRCSCAGRFSCEDIFHAKIQLIIFSRQCPRKYLSSPCSKNCFSSICPRKWYYSSQKDALELIAISCYWNGTLDWVNNGDCVRGSDRIGAPNICWRGPGTKSGPASIHIWLKNKIL